MQYVTTVLEIDFGEAKIPRETILPVEDFKDGFWRVVSGPYTGKRIYGYECTIFPLYQELLQRREEVKELMGTSERSAKKLERADASIFKLCDRIEALQKEKSLLLQQIERTLDEQQPKPVVLPKEVAEELDRAIREHGKDADYLAWSIAQKPDANSYGGESMELLREQANNGSFLELVDAIRYGYTIAEPESFQANRKLNKSEIRALRNWYKGALLRMEDGTDPDGFAKEAIEEAVVYFGGAELIKDMSGFCKTQLERENAQQSG